MPLLNILPRIDVTDSTGLVIAMNKSYGKLFQFPTSEVHGSNVLELVRQGATNKNQIKRILYAADLTKSAPKVYQYVLYLAKQFNAEIIFLHVIDKYSQDANMILATYFPKEVQQEVLLRESNKSLDEMAHRNRQTFIRQQLGLEDGLCPDQLGLTIVDKVAFGNVEEQILKHSINSDSDLVVMGAHEKPLFTFTTTLSKRVMKRSRVPVTVVPISGERKKQSAGFLLSFLPQFSAARCK